MRKFIQYFVNHSLFVNLISIFCLIAGILCLIAIRREAFPNISYDVVTIQTNYFGAPPEEVEKLVSIKIEDELIEINGIDEMTSVSSENISMIVLQLDPDEPDKRKVVNDIQRAVDRVDDLPAEVEDDPIVTEFESKNFPVINVSLSGPFEEIELQKIARKLETSFLDLPDVAKINRTGWRDREIWVETKPDILREYKLSTEDIVTALKNQNLNIPAGTLHTIEGDFLVRTIGEFETAEEIENVIIRANDRGNWIRIKDVATVKDTFEDDDKLERTYGERAITLTVVKKEKGDIIRLVRDIKKAAENFKLESPEGLKISYFDDFSYYVKRRLNVLKNNGFIGLILVITCLLVFLTRTVAMMTAIGIPIALMTTFAIMYFMGMTINLITMFGLIMVLGMVVDDAIIIAENIYRHIEKGVPPKEAAVIGASEVAVPVVATVMTTIMAFIPLFYMSGIIGKFIASIPLVVIIALGASLFESLVILPSHLADFARPGGDKKKKDYKWFTTFRNKYLSLLTWVLSHRKKAMIVFGAIFIGSIVLYITSMRFVLFPQGLIEEFFVKARAPVGVSLDEMEIRMKHLEEIVSELPPQELDNYVTSIGVITDSVDDPYSDRGTHLGMIHVFLTPEKTRGRRKVDPMIEEIRKKVEPHKGLFEEITFEKVRAGPPVGKPVSIRFRGDRFEELEAVADKTKEFLSSMDGLKDVRDDYDLGKSQLRIYVNEQKATQAYLTVQDIAVSTRNALEGGTATTIQKTDEEIDVIVRYPKTDRSSREIFNQVEIPNRLGNLVPLSKISDLEETRGVHAIKRFDRKRMINVTSDVDEKMITPIEVEVAMRKFFKEKIVKDYPGISLSFGGEQEESKKSLRDFVRALVLALLLIFIILAANFNSVVRSGIVMSAIPYGISGVIFAFFLHGQPLSFMALLGTIGLSGVVVNDSIVLVSFIHQMRDEGKDRIESVLEAGKLRFRPVMLTTITTVFGLMPVAYGLGGADPFLKPMALAISWGLFFATTLTLLVVPCLYVISDDAKRLMAKGWEKAHDIPAFLHLKEKFPKFFN